MGRRRGRGRALRKLLYAARSIPLAADQCRQGRYAYPYRLSLRSARGAWEFQRVQRSTVGSAPPRSSWWPTSDVRDGGRVLSVWPTCQGKTVWSRALRSCYLPDTCSRGTVSRTVVCCRGLPGGGDARTVATQREFCTCVCGHAMFICIYVSVRVCDCVHSLCACERVWKRVRKKMR